jgi:methionyl-tRNA formyltransferase
MQAEIPVLQPTKLRDGALARQLQDADVDLGVVVAYGRILPPDLFRSPVFETVNVHASLLPRWRGASPIQHAILHGDLETGVTLMKLSEGMDEGDMLLQREVDIPPHATGGSLFETLADLGGETLIDGLRRAKTTGLTVEPQPDVGVTYAPLLHKRDGELDTRLAAEPLARRVRAFDPWPGTYLSLGSGPLKVLRAQAVRDVAPHPGVLLELEPRCVVGTADGGLELVTVQPAGKRPMAAADFLRGQGRGWRVRQALRDL